MTRDDALRLALEALHYCFGGTTREESERRRAISMLKAVLEQPQPSSFNVLSVTTAYEQGFGSGTQRRGHNPYSEASPEHEAWDRGYARGLKRSEPPQQEPVGYLVAPVGEFMRNPRMVYSFPPQSVEWEIPVYTTPPRREWVGLTDDDLMNLPGFDYDEAQFIAEKKFARAIETKLKERNA